MSECVAGRVSVIVPVRNRPSLLKRAVQSVREQTYGDWELWIVDDGSTDDTPAVAESLVREDSRIQLMRQEPSGPGAAREAGRQRARGEFIQYLDSDDCLLAAKFERMVEALHTAPELAIAYCRCRELDPQGRPIPSPVRPSDRKIDAILPAFLHFRFWNTGVPLYRKALLDQAGPWLPLNQEEDWELDVRLARLSPRLIFVDELLVECTLGSADGLSGKVRETAALLVDRATAHLAVLEHALACGLEPGQSDLARFARSLFLLSRQCAAQGYVLEARKLLEAAVCAAGPNRAAARGLQEFRWLANLLGWRGLGRLALALDRVRGFGQ